MTVVLFVEKLAKKLLLSQYWLIEGTLCTIEYRKIHLIIYKFSFVKVYIPVEKKTFDFCRIIMFDQRNTVQYYQFLFVLRWFINLNHYCNVRAIYQML